MKRLNTYDYEKYLKGRVISAQAGIHLISGTSRRGVSTVSSTNGQQHNCTPLPVHANIPYKLDNHIHKGNAGNHPGKKFTGILPKSRFFGQKWLNNMLGEANGANYEWLITNDELSVINNGHRISEENSGNHPGKKFTGILPKSRFFGRKWLNNMLGEANKYFAIYKKKIGLMNIHSDTQLWINIMLSVFACCFSPESITKSSSLAIQRFKYWFCHSLWKTYTLILKRFFRYSYCR